MVFYYCNGCGSLTTNGRLFRAGRYEAWCDSCRNMRDHEAQLADFKAGVDRMKEKRNPQSEDAPVEPDPFNGLFGLIEMLHCNGMTYEEMKRRLLIL